MIGGGTDRVNLPLRTLFCAAANHSPNTKDVLVGGGGFDPHHSFLVPALAFCGRDHPTTTLAHRFHSSLEVARSGVCCYVSPGHHLLRFGGWC
jgi:hypothetical protein